MLQVRAIRAELNKVLQTRRSVAEVQADGAAFGEKYGDSIWGCACKGSETFADLYNAHLKRVQENEADEEQAQDRIPGIRVEISNCGNLHTFADIKRFVEIRPELNDDAQVLWELSEKGIELGHPDYLDDGEMP